MPELAERDPRFAAITIRDLMMMAAGLEYEAMRPGFFNGDDVLTTYHPDQRKMALENTQIVDPPGEYFLYNKYHPQLLGLILKRATGVSVTEYMQRVLWDFLGMEFGGEWSLDSEASGFKLGSLTTRAYLAPAWLVGHPAWTPESGLVGAVLWGICLLAAWQVARRKSEADGVGVT